MADKKIPQGLIIDGLFSVKSPDSSGEILDIDGADISDLEEGRGLANYEHRNDKQEGASANDIVGRVLMAKKLYKEGDCSTDRERKFYKMVNLPCIYGQIELFDAEGHEGAKACAALIRHYDARGLPLIMKYSVEGSTLDQDGQNIKKCIIRRIALTVKPANKAAASGVLNDPKAHSNVKEDKDPLDNTEKNEHPSYQRLSSVELECNPILKMEDNDLVKVKAFLKLALLKKAIAAGSYNAAPSTLTGGSALQVEDRNLHRQRLKNQIKAVVRDYRKSDGDLKLFIKHRLPEADPDFIDTFANLVEEYSIKKTEKMDNLKMSVVQAMEALTIELKHATKLLQKDEGQPKPEPSLPSHVLWKDKIYKPGQATGQGSINRGKKYMIIAPMEDPLYRKPDGSYIPHGHYVKPIDELEAFPHSLYDPSDPHYGYQIHSEPALDVSQFVLNHTLHAPAPYIKYPEQAELINGTNINDGMGVRPQGTAAGYPINSGVSQWRKMGNGKMAYVKRLNSKTPTQLTEPQHEVLVHNLAKEMKLGDYFPTTSLFQHPVNGSFHSVMEKVPNGEHYQAWNEEPIPAHKVIFDQLDKQGTLQKLALFDQMIGNTDRHKFNYMLTHDQTPDGTNHSIKMIDNGLAFSRPHDSVDNSGMFPHDNNYETKIVHPETSGWLDGLDSDKYEKTLVEHGMDPVKAFQFTERLVRLQDFSRRNPLSSFGSLTSHVSSFERDHYNKPAEIK